MNRIIRISCIALAICIVSGLILWKSTATTEAAASNGSGSGSGASLVMYAGSPYALVNGAEATIDPEDLEITPVVKEGARMVPVRFIAESVGAVVEWDQASASVNISYKGRTIKIRQGSKSIYTGNTESTLSTPAVAMKGRTYVPLDGYAAALGLKVFYERGLIVLGGDEDMPDPVSDSLKINSLISKVNYLPSLGSYKNLKALLEKSLASENHQIGNNIKAKAAFDSSPAFSTSAAEATRAAAAPQASGAEKADYSSTNVQVQGVDEADGVKTDGQYIYQVNKQRVVVAKAYPAEDMKLESLIDYTGTTFIPKELYVDENMLVVIGSTNNIVPMLKSDINEKRIYPPRYLMSTVMAVIYDITDRSKVKKLREVELEGSYVSSRKIGESLYIVSNRYMDYYHIMREEDNPTPSYRDTASGDTFINADYKDIRYFPDMAATSYLTVTGIDLGDMSKAAAIDTYLGSGENIYASEKSLYVAVSGYYRNSSRTLVYKFGLEEGKASYLGKGEVPGTVLNQFSMDENGGCFRIATTRGDIVAGAGYVTSNNVYILDEILGLKGKIEDIAPGEKIYSVRFMGDRGYVVTFKTVDPLFVLDLKDPAKPSVLGALKIPGYSDYMHPYDENHIIGFGKDTVEVSGGAFYLGMKLAIFDVSDVSNPKQMFTEIIGDRGTDSELLRDHRALLFSREKGLLSFPVTVMEVQDKSLLQRNGLPQYGQFTFQGAYVYNIDLEKGFELKGKITHLTGNDYLKAGNNWFGSDKKVNRVLYINDTLYTLSNGMIKANSLEDLSDKGSLRIQQ